LGFCTHYFVSAFAHHVWMVLMQFVGLRTTCLLKAPVALGCHGVGRVQNSQWTSASTHILTRWGSCKHPTTSW